MLNLNEPENPLSNDPSPNKWKFNVPTTIASVGLCLALAMLVFQHSRMQEMASISHTEQERFTSALNQKQTEISALQEENSRLKETARFHYDQAVAALNSADAANTDDADRTAISAFGVVEQRFPDDALANAAKQKIAALNGRIEARRVAIERAQLEVNQLINACHQGYVKVRQINAQTSVFTPYGHIDYYGQEQAHRQTEPYERSADTAKKRAQALLSSVPDPDGSLAKRVSACEDIGDDEQ
jgi:hypothetical protein